MPCPLLESNRVLGRIAHVDPNRVQDRAIKVVARWQRNKAMRRQLRGWHLKLDLSALADSRPTVVGEAHRRQEGLAAEVMMAAGSRSYAQKHRPRAAVLQRDQVSVSSGLDGMPPTAAMTENWIVRTGFEWSQGESARRRDLAVVVGRAALGSQQIGPAVQSMKVRPLGPDPPAPRQINPHGPAQLAGACIDLGLLNDRMIEVRPFSVASGSTRAAVEKQRRIEPTLIDPHRIRPGALGSASRDQEIAAAAHMRGHQEESPTMVAQSRRVDAA